MVNIWLSPDKSWGIFVQRQYRNQSLLSSPYRNSVPYKPHAHSQVIRTHLCFLDHPVLLAASLVYLTLGYGPWLYTLKQHRKTKVTKQSNKHGKQQTADASTSTEAVPRWLKLGNIPRQAQVGHAGQQL